MRAHDWLALLVVLQQHTVREQPELLLESHVAPVRAINLAERGIIAWGEQSTEALSVVFDCLCGMGGSWPILAVHHTSVGCRVREELEECARDSSAELRARIKNTPRRTEAGRSLDERGVVELQSTHDYASKERKPGGSWRAFNFNGRHNEQLLAWEYDCLGMGPVGSMPGYHDDEFGFGMQFLQRIKYEACGPGRGLLQAINEQRDMALVARAGDLTDGEERQILGTPVLKQACDLGGDPALQNAIEIEMVEKLRSEREPEHLHRNVSKSARDPQQGSLGRQGSHVLIAVQRYEAGNAALLERLCRESQLRALSNSGGTHHEQR